MSISKAPPGTGWRLAYWPIQRTIAAGSVRCRKTSSTGAGRSTSVVNGSVRPLLSLMCGSGWIGERGREPIKMLGPEVGEEVLHRAESAGVDHEQVAGALAALIDQARLMQDFQVTGDSLGGDPDVARDVADRAGVRGDEPEDGAAVRFGERFECRIRVHGWRPRKAASRCVTGASPPTATGGPMREARLSGVARACSANASTCAASRPSRSAGWPVALARSQPCTRMSSVVNPARPGPGMSPSGVWC